MQIHLAQPGGERRGPYTLEEVNQDLAAKKYRDTDYWAWYDGTDAWVPLYSVPGILESAFSAHSAATEPDSNEIGIAAELEEPETTSANAAVATVRAAKTTERQPAPAPAKSQLASGMPFAALDQIFIFTTGEGP